MILNFNFGGYIIYIYIQTRKVIIINTRMNDGRSYCSLPYYILFLDVKINKTSNVDLNRTFYIDKAFDHLERRRRIPDAGRN